MSLPLPLQSHRFCLTSQIITGPTRAFVRLLKRSDFGTYVAGTARRSQEHAMLVSGAGSTISTGDF